MSQLILLCYCLSVFRLGSHFGSATTLIRILLASCPHEADSVNSQVSPCNAESTLSLLRQSLWSAAVLSYKGLSLPSYHRLSVVVLPSEVI